MGGGGVGVCNFQKWRKVTQNEGFFTPLRTMIKGRVKKFVALLTKEKQLRMNGKMMTLTFCDFYSMSINN